jgi:hypothetical protein
MNYHYKYNYDYKPDEEIVSEQELEFEMLSSILFTCPISEEDEKWLTEYYLMLKFNTKMDFKEVEITSEVEDLINKYEELVKKYLTLKIEADDTGKKLSSHIRIMKSVFSNHCPYLLQIIDFEIIKERIE